jgi:hypothetical protein
VLTSRVQGGAGSRAFREKRHHPFGQVVPAEQRQRLVLDEGAQVGEQDGDPVDDGIQMAALGVPALDEALEHVPIPFPDLLPELQ